MTLVISSSEESLDFADDFDEAVDFFGRVVEIKARASRGFHAELFHERLVAMMPAAQRHTAIASDKAMRYTNFLRE
jgi:hypothetical protein